jgi:hypothetical protein
MYNVVLNDTATQLDPTLTASVGGIPFSINGVHTKVGFLYFTNTALGFYRVSIFHDGIPVGNSVGSDRIDKRTIDNRANLSIIDNRLSIMIIIELGGKGPSRIYPSYSLF